MEMRILHLYPDLMNLYGSYGNVAILARTLTEMGHSVTVQAVLPPDRPCLAQADAVFIGAGTERAQKAALSALSPWGAEVRAAAADGAVMLFAGNAMELLGRRITGEDGTVYPALEVGTFETHQQRRRLVGDVYGHTDLFPEAVVGFMNRASRIDGVETPLLRHTDLGIGNQGVGSPEGFHRENVFASQLTGPILIKNPALLQTVAAAVCRRRGAEAAPVPVDGYMAQGWAVTARQLKDRCRRLPGLPGRG